MVYVILGGRKQVLKVKVFVIWPSMEVQNERHAGL